MTRLRWAAPIGLIALLLLLVSCGGSTTINPTPAISGLFPDSIAATQVGPPNCTNNPGITVNIQGSNFLATSVAYWNGSQRKTAFNVESGQLAMTVLACDIAQPGSNFVTVVNPAPGGGPTQSAATFVVTQPSNPAPAISSLSPASATVGVLPPNGILTINGPGPASGSNSPAFISSSVVAFNGVTRSSTFVSATELQVQMLASDVATATTINVTVSNAAPGGGVANAQFAVTDPQNAATFPQVVSVGAIGGPADGASSSPAMSADGRYVAFVSSATNLVPVGRLGRVFVRDTCLGSSGCFPSTFPVDVTPQGGAPNGAANGSISISTDGRFVAFASYATDLVSGTPGNSPSGVSNVFVRDTCLGSNAPKSCVVSTAAVSVDAGGNLGSLSSDSPSLSADGRFVAFASFATNLVPGSSPHASAIFVRDTCGNAAASSGCTPTTIELPANGANGAGSLSLGHPSISGNGRYIAFDSRSASSAPGTGGAGIFLADTCLGATAPAGCEVKTVAVAAVGGGVQGENPSVSDDGRFVVFEATQILRYDTCFGSTALASCVPGLTNVTADAVGSVANAPSYAPFVSSSGRFISFVSSATNLVPGVTSGAPYVFVRDTCFAALVPCAPQTVAVALAAADAVTGGFPAVPLTPDGRFAAFHAIRPVAALPTSGLGDVFLTTASPQTQE